MARHRGQHRLGPGRQTVAEIARWIELHPPTSVRDDWRLYRRERISKSMWLVTNPWTGQQFYEFTNLMIKVPDYPLNLSTLDGLET